MDLVYVLTNIRPNSMWTIRREQIYNNLYWYPNNTTLKPTLEECEEYWNTYETTYLINILRVDRDKKLLDTDKYSLPDWPHSSEEVKQAWLTYRQALRDLPANSLSQVETDRNLTNVIWPTPPS